MSQSSFVAALLLAAFLLYLAVNNRLVTYAAILWGNTAAPLPQQNAPSGGVALPGLDLSGATDPTATTGGLPGLPDFSGLGDGSGGFGSIIEQAAPALLEAL